MIGGDKHDLDRLFRYTISALSWLLNAGRLFETVRVEAMQAFTAGEGAVVDVANMANLLGSEGAVVAVEGVVDNVGLILEAVFLLENGRIAHEIRHVDHLAADVDERVARILDGAPKVVDLPDVLYADEVDAHRRDRQPDDDI